MRLTHWVRGSRRALVSTVALVTAATAQVGLPAHAQECEVKLGVVGPMSGGGAIWGISARQGAQRAAAEVNDAGGLAMGDKKCRVVVVSQDSKYTAEGAAAAANALASQGISVIVGPIGSPEATGIKPVAERNRQVTMNASHAKDAIGAQWPHAFHAAPGPASWARVLAKRAKDQFNFKSVVLIAPNDQAGTDVASVDAQAYKELGVEVKEEYYQRGTANFAPIVARILRSNPEVVDTASSPPGDAATMVKQLLEAGFKGVFGRLGGSATDEIIKAAGGVEALGNFYWMESIYVEQALLADIAAKQKSWGDAPPGNPIVVALFSASGRLALKAISQAGTGSDGTKVAEALRKLPLDDPWLGKGEWTGMSSFGIRQEFGFPVGLGMIADGKHLGVSAVSVVGQ